MEGAYFGFFVRLKCSIRVVRAKRLVYVYAPSYEHKHLHRGFYTNHFVTLGKIIAVVKDLFNFFVEL